MAVIGRLTFLYPHLLRAATRSTGPTAAWAEAGAAKGWTTSRRTTTSRAFATRHGKAVEPTDWEKQQQQQQQQPSPPTSPPPEQQQQQQPQQVEVSETKTPEDSPKPNIGKLLFEEEAKKETKETASKESAQTEAPASKQQQDAKAKQQDQVTPIEMTSAETPTETQQVDAKNQANSPAGAQDGAKKSDMLETVFYMGAPENVARKTPSLSPPKYVHHFDSYSLVKQLQDAGYSNEQAITMMKAIRTILAHNLDMAQERLVSKSDVENESYLFSAACSELGAELKNNRRIQDEQMRQGRTHLQHEVDILTQTLNQQLITLTDNVRGLFNDRKMAVREGERSIDSAIQKINYKISIMLSSDSKSEIEGVRWILIRRSVVGIIFMAILTLGTIRLATFTSHERAREEERKKHEDEELKKDGGKSDLTAAPDAAAILTAN